MSDMKHFFSFLFLILSVLIFFGLVFLSSPYRELRPYELFGKNIPEKLGQETKIISGRKAVLIHSDEETNDFYIDQIPVTIGDYKACVHSGKCETQHYRDNYANIYDQRLYEIFPVSFVTWMEARNYCNAFGGDLPTAKQWDLAAGADFEYIYPWGSSLPNLERANIDGLYQWLTPSGWLPKGASPYGVLDMTGNVREWVLDEIFEDTDDKVLKGGSDHNSYTDGRIDAFFTHAPTSSGFNRGFRCVYK